MVKPDQTPEKAAEEPRELKREVLGVGLLALALLVLLALVPLQGFAEPGTRLDRWFPSGNVMGVAGGAVQAGAYAVLGVAAIVLPFVIALAGLRLGGWLAGSSLVRLSTLAAGVLLLVPAAARVYPLPAGWEGWVGERLAEPLVALLGGFGAGLLLLVLFVLLVVATLGWSPIRRPVLWIREGAMAVRSRTAGLLEGRRKVRLPTGAPWEEAGEPEGPSAEAEARVGDGDGPPGEGETDRPPAARDSFRELPDPRDPRELSGDEVPPLELLTPAPARGRGDMERELDSLGDVLVEKLRTFNVESEIGGRTTGPVVTQYEVIPAPGVKVNRIANLDADLALAMKARTIRIVAPIPGKGAVGVEIPNPAPQTVHLREILESDQFGRSRAELPLALGKDLHGEPYVADLAKMPHCLIAGATGSGKSVLLNTVITSLLYRHSPENLRLLLIDPKMVELSTYEDLPHLRHPVVTHPGDAAGVLKWAVLEMERRYALLSANGVRSIGEFNRRLGKGAEMRRATPVGEEGDPDRWIYDGGPLRYVVLVVDELADLMMNVQSEVEKPLTLLAQKARAIGIHLLVATQRPSVNVITGLIKANFPCRIAFRVSSKTDSRTILDQNGADALLGDGDMLFLPPGQSTPIRIQGAYISTEDTERLMDWFRELRERKLDEGLEDPASRAEDDILELVREKEAEEAGHEMAFEGDWDELFREAAEVCIQHEQGSTSLLQRKLRIGYGRAARIVDQLHEAGVLGPPDGSKPREVLMSLDQLERMLSGEVEVSRDVEA